MFHPFVEDSSFELYPGIPVFYSKCAASSANPIMTHRQFGFTYPIANVGHADLVDTPSGNWYAVLLASRIIGGVQLLGDTVWRVAA